jgi:hypothetical protein
MKFATGLAALLLTSVGTLRAGDPDVSCFRDDFQGGLQPAWRIVAGQAKVAERPDNPGRRFLELSPGSVVMLQANKPLRDFVVEAKVRFIERKNDNAEAPFLLRARPGGDSALQVYLAQPSNAVLAVRWSAGAVLGRALSPVSLKAGPWYAVKIVAIGNRVATWVDGKLALAIYDEQPRPGSIGMRVGNACTNYSDFALRTPSEDEIRQVRGLRLPDRAKPEMRESVFSLPDGARAVLHHPDIAEPAMPFAVTLDTSAVGSFVLVADGQTLPIKPGMPVQVGLGGPQGPKELLLVRDGRKIGVAAISLQADTFFEAGPYTDLFHRLWITISGDRAVLPYRGGHIQTNPTWVRDHVHEMKGYKFWEQDLTSYIDALLALQHPDGFFYEILTFPENEHLTFVKPKHRLVDRENHIGWVRLELEADVEYLMVEGAWTIWQATGDRRAMEARLPRLERALNYCFTDPTRWDEKHGALKRPFTPDTWDFTYGKSPENRRIEPDTPMAIMHGDNSGLYAACRQLAAMFRIAGQEAKSRAWEAKAAALRERINRLCFNGKYYTHQILLQPVKTGVKEEDILSLSNAYDINRGLPTHEMAVKIIDEYQRRRLLRAKTHFAEWFSLDPPYPQFGPYPAGSYINGGIASFTAGELAKAALDEGRENYGVDILRRVARKVAQDKALYFLYTVDGKNQGGGPSGWGAAAVISALVEGLAGIRDDGALFDEVTVSPRFAAAHLDSAQVCLRYGPSLAYMAVGYEHRPTERRISLRLAGVAKKAHVRLLLPEGATSARLLSPAGMDSRLETIEQSRYLVFDLSAPLTQNCQVRVQYETAQ